MRENETDREKFKQKILADKKLLGWTNIEFAKQMNASINTANHWLHGTYMPKEPKKTEILNILKNALEVKGL